MKTYTVELTKEQIDKIAEMARVNMDGLHWNWGYSMAKSILESLDEIEE